DYYARFILDNKYYNSNGLGEFKITNKGRTLALRAHLGDLEAGEGDYSKLREDFSIFSTVKIEVEQHPLGSFQHIICFDSTGYGGKTAPYPQQLKHDTGDDNTNQFGSSLAVGIIILIIIISIIGFILLRREAKMVTPDEKIVIDTTKPAVGGLGMPMQMQMPSGPMGMRGVPGRFPSTGTRPMFIPPSMMRPGGRPMMPMSRPPLPPTSGKGKGRISPITTGKKSTTGKKKK
ncbi:MAG: hypothetical protein KAJ51_14725, partial [Thermoplasmata archaeon]|nr:hypothetical protein [Thermoplasmata archaeon]